MEEHVARILDVHPVTHDVRRFRVEKPDGYSFVPGQATEVSVNLPDWKEEKRPFTFTGLNPDPYLEFTIKIYPERGGVTNELGKLKPGDELILRDVWGAINYKGKGTFIAGGAGVTPFIAIFRDLESRGEVEGNRLLFGNKTIEDIILRNEFERMLGKNFLNILSHQNVPGFAHGFFNREFLEKNIDPAGRFYVCGPPPMMDVVMGILNDLNVDKESVTIEL